jgi:predicted nuclease of predicted toxin-antitoxin system
LATAPDPVIWRHAIAHGEIIVTKDEDFIALRALNATGPAIVWIRVGNTTRDNLLRIIRLVLPAIVDALEQGEVIVEVTAP